MQIQNDTRNNNKPAVYKRRAHLCLKYDTLMRGESSEVKKSGGQHIFFT